MADHSAIFDSESPSLNRSKKRDNTLGMSRQVLDAHIGLTNTVTQHEIDSLMIATFRNIRGVLSDYCGPYGKYAMITDPTNPVAQPTFTKDGINIINAMEFLSPIERYVKDAVSYIGSRVERSAGDGSTSSMIIMTTVLESIRQYLSGTKITYNRFCEHYKEFEELVFAELDKGVIKLDQEAVDTDLVDRIAFSQSYTSTHGNVELSRLVATMFKKLPPSAWDYITYSRDTHESDSKYTLEVDDSDYSAPASVYENWMYNTKYGNGVDMSNVTLVISSDELLKNGSNYTRIHKLLKDAIEDTTKRLVIFIPAGTDVATRTELSIMLQPVSNHKRIAIINLNASNPTINDVGCLLAVCGYEYPVEKDEGVVVIESTEDRPIRVQLQDHIVKVWGILPDSDSSVNEQSTIPDHPTAKKLKLLDEFLTNIKTSASRYMNKQDVALYKRMYNNLLLRRQYNLKIGGSAYDNEAAVDIVEDALKASREALRHGIVLGGYATLLGVMRRLITTYSDITKPVSDSSKNSILCSLATAYAEGILYVQHVVVDSYVTNMDRYSYNSIHDMIVNGDVMFDVINERYYRLDEVHDTSRVIVQPVTVDKSLISRLGEIALKFLFTSRIIIPGGVVVGDTK